MYESPVFYLQDIPVLSLYIQRCNHDRSATQNLTPISRCFKYIFSHFYAYFAPNGYKLAFKKHPYFRIPSTLLLNHPYFRNFKYTFTKPPLFYKSFIYIFFVLKKLFFFFLNILQTRKRVHTGSILKLATTITSYLHAQYRVLWFC